MMWLCGCNVVHNCVWTVQGIYNISNSNSTAHQGIKGVFCVLYPLQYTSHRVSPPPPDKALSIANHRRGKDVCPADGKISMVICTGQPGREREKLRKQKPHVQCYNNHVQSSEIGIF